MDGIRKRISELHTITHDLEIRAATMLEQLESIVDTFDKKNLDLWFELLDLLEFHDVTLI